jgi:hypothetical protein
MNEEKLSPAERTEMRDLVTTGVRRMRAARARRMQAGAVAAAVVLVAIVVTGVSFAAFRSDDRVAKPVETTSAPSPTPTHSPSSLLPSEAPSPSPEPVRSSELVLPFGNECANAMSADAVSEWMGTSVRLTARRWTDPALTMSGGITCLWSIPDAYLWGYVEMTAFPRSVFDAAGTAPVASGTCEQDTCRAAAIVDDMWIAMRWVGGSNDVDRAALRSVGPDDFASLFAELDSASDAFPSPMPAERQVTWWPESGCDQVVASVPHDAASTSLVTLDDYVEQPWRVPEIAGLGADYCRLTDSQGGEMIVSVVPGGATTYDEIANSEYARFVDVPGSDGAVYVPNHYVWEFNGNDLVVRSGANLLIVGGYPTTDGDELLEELVALATPTLDALNATLG